MIDTPPQAAASTHAQELSKRAQELSDRIDDWNTWYLVFVVVALIVAFFVFWAQFKIIRQSRKLSTAQQDLIAEKDRQLTSSLGEKDRNIASVKTEADEKIATLNARALIAESGIAEANERAAAADLARVALQEKIAPRRLSLEQQQRIRDFCFERSMGLGRVIIASYALDIEAAGVAKQIAASLRFNGTQVILQAGSRSTNAEPEEGIAVRAARSEEREATCVAEALKDIGHLSVTLNGPAKQDPTQLLGALNSINVGSIPTFPGGPLPDGFPVFIMVGVKPLLVLDSPSQAH